MFQPRLAHRGGLAGLLGALALWLGLATPAYAVDPAGQLAPSMLTFPSVEVFTGASSDGVLTLTNTSAGTLAVLTSTITGSGSDVTSFSVVVDECTGRTLAAGASCNYTLRFIPTRTGPNGAALTLTTDAALGPLPAQLVGTGLTAPRPPPAVNIVPPAISGTPDEGQVLSCSPGTWSDPTASFDYFWARGGLGIQDASEQTYTLQYDDVGFEITCRAFAATLGGRTVAVSKSVVPVDRLAPVCTVSADSQNLPTVRSKGFLVIATCSEPVTARFTLSLSKSDKKTYRLASTTVGSDEQTFAAKGANRLRVLIDSTPKKRLAKAKRLRFTMTVTATDRVKLTSKPATVTATAKKPSS